MHSNDSYAKALILSHIIRANIPACSNKPFSLLEVGGGAGLVSFYLCKILLEENFFTDSNSFILHSLEPSSESIKLQQKNNPFISQYYHCSFGESPLQTHYDCVLLIDVLEHIPDIRSTIQLLTTVSDFCLINLPLEDSLFDKLRNILTFGRYYHFQRTSLGHIHRFNYHSARTQFYKYFDILHFRHWPYFEHLLDLKSKSIVKFSWKRLFELYLSRMINLVFPSISPFIIQGSTFILLVPKT